MKNVECAIGGIRLVGAGTGRSGVGSATGPFGANEIKSNAKNVSGQHLHVPRAERDQYVIRASFLPS
jgi:hypothetical protein